MAICPRGHNSGTRATVRVKQHEVEHIIVKVVITTGLQRSADKEEEDDNTEGIIFTQPPFNQPARVYDYKSESECDKHVQVFMDCIHSVRDVSAEHNGFAALKVTALGNPSK